MSLITDILDRLSGIAVVREQLNETTRNLERLADWLLDHEKRLTTLEATRPALEYKKKRKK